MLVEQETAIHLDDNEDLLSIYVGELWDEFKYHIPEEQSKTLVTGFNLIIISSVPEEDFTLGELPDYTPETVVLSVLPNILLDETLDTPNKKEVVYLLLINNIIELLEKLGIKFEEDYVNLESIDNLITLLDFFFVLDDYEDLIGLKDLLTSDDIDQKDRLLDALELYHGESFDIEPLTYLISDVSDLTLTTLADSLKRELGQEDEEIIPISFKERIKNNKHLFVDNFVTEHVKFGAELGSPITNLFAFFANQIAELVDNPTEDNLVEYARCLAQMYLISDENDSAIKEGCLSHITELVDDLTTYNKAECIINELVLTNE